MKTILTIATMLVVMPCGCRAPRPLGSASDIGGHALAADGTAAPRDSQTFPAAMSESGPGTPSNLPVSELLARAEQAIHAQQHVVARGQLQSILVQQPNHPRAHHLLAVIADLDRRFVDAEQHYFAALAQDPHNASIVGDLGYSYYLQSRFQESEQYLQRSLEFDPEHFSAARNLAQLLSDRGETARAEQLLRSLLPATEVEFALQQLRQQQPPDDPSLFSNLIPGRNQELTGTELTQQIRGQMDAAARAQVAARDQRRREHEFRGTQLTETGRSVDHISQLSQDGSVSINPWSRQLSEIDGAGVQSHPQTLLVGPGAPPIAEAGGHPTANLARPNSQTTPPRIQSVGGQSPDDELPVVQPAFGTRTGVDSMPDAGPNIEPAERRFPPATWTPLTETPASADRSYNAEATHLPQPFAGGGVHQASASVSPWNVDVRHAVGRGGNSEVDRAYFEDRVSENVILPVAVQEPNTPAVIPNWGHASSSTATPRFTPGTDSYSNGAQYPPPQRDLPGSPQGWRSPQTSATQPAHVPTAGTTGTYQAVRQSYNASMNDGVGSTYSQSPAGRTHSPASAAASPAYEVPVYPHGPAAGSAPPVSPETGTPWPSRMPDNAADTGWTQESPNTTPGVAVPEHYRVGQQPAGSAAGTYERYPGARGY